MSRGGSGRGCSDQVFAVKQNVEKTIEKGKMMYMAFVDLEKAYDGPIKAA